MTGSGIKSYSCTHFSALFPEAVKYREWRDMSAGVIRETGPLRATRPFSERHLQCVWANPQLRPARLKNSRDELVTVLDPGRWNLESGPDFIDAVIEVGPDKRRICGDVEIHINPSDWNQHRHHADPRYENVCAHITYFNAPLPPDKLPPGAAQISLRKSLLSNPYFAFENIDVTAYPYNIKTTRAPCATILREWGRTHKEGLLDAAGQERLLRKSEFFFATMENGGTEQVVYEEVLRALGYKNNKAPFKYLAEILPVGSLREDVNGDQLQAYALLMGLSGLLPDTVESEWDKATATFVRDLWDRWWKMEERWGRLIMDSDCWSRTGIRPQNRPERRLMVTAELFSDPQPLSQRWLAAVDSHPTKCVRKVIEQLTSVGDNYWSRRLTWSGEITPAPVALLGRSRAAAIAVNVFAPFLAAVNASEAFDEGLLDQLPAESLNAIMRRTAHVLFGPDHPPVIYRSAVRRQGLMQIFHDYCLSDRSGCKDCGFPRLLKNHLNVPGCSE